MSGLAVVYTPALLGIAKGLLKFDIGTGYAHLDQLPFVYKDLEVVSAAL